MSYSGDTFYVSPHATAEERYAQLGKMTADRYTPGRQMVSAAQQHRIKQYQEWLRFHNPAQYRQLAFQGQFDPANKFSMYYQQKIVPPASALEHEALARMGITSGSALQNPNIAADMHRMIDQLHRERRQDWYKQEADLVTNPETMDQVRNQFTDYWMRMAGGHRDQANQDAILQIMNFAAQNAATPEEYNSMLQDMTVDMMGRRGRSSEFTNWLTTTSAQQRAAMNSQQQQAQADTSNVRTDPATGMTFDADGNYVPPDYVHDQDPGNKPKNSPTTAQADRASSTGTMQPTAADAQQAKDIGSKYAPQPTSQPTSTRSWGTATRPSSGTHGTYTDAWGNIRYKAPTTRPY